MSDTPEEPEHSDIYTDIRRSIDRENAQELRQARSRIDELERRLAERPVNYLENLKIAWLWMWRGFVLTGVAIAGSVLVFTTFVSNKTLLDSSYYPVYVAIASLLLVIAPVAIQPWMQGAVEVRLLWQLAKRASVRCPLSIASV